MARALKFWISEEIIVLSTLCAGDLRLYFRKCKKAGFLVTQLNYVLIVMWCYNFLCMLIMNINSPYASYQYFPRREVVGTPRVSDSEQISNPVNESTQTQGQVLKIRYFSLHTKHADDPSRGI